MDPIPARTLAGLRARSEGALATGTLRPSESLDAVWNHLCAGLEALAERGGAADLPENGLTQRLVNELERHPGARPYYFLPEHMEDDSDGHSPRVDVAAMARDGGGCIVNGYGASAPAVPPRWVEPALPRWVEPLAWDAEGALYSLWTNQEGLWLARSRDQGDNWTSWHMGKGDGVLYFPYLIARGHGELAGTWFSGVGEVRDTGGEYLAVTFLRTGGLAMVSPIQNQRAQQFGFSWWRIEVR